MKLKVRKQRKKMTRFEKFMWLKVVIGMAIFIVGVFMLLLNFGTTEENIQNLVLWGVIGAIGLSIARAGTPGGCLA